jgi:hypothetical protein
MAGSSVICWCVSFHSSATIRPRDAIELHYTRPDVQVEKSQFGVVHYSKTPNIHEHHVFHKYIVCENYSKGVKISTVMHIH